MKKTLLYIFAAMLFSLSFWQIVRFRNKHEEFVFFEQQNSIINDHQNIFADDNFGYLYYWMEKKFTLNGSNSEVYRILKDIIDGKKSHDRTHREITAKDLYSCQALCGDYLNNKGFLIYNPRKNDDIMREGYSIIVPILFKNKIVLIKYGHFTSKGDGESELKELNNSESKLIFPNMLDSTNKTAICFNGILANMRYYLSHKLTSVFVKNDIEGNYWVNLNKGDLEEHFKNSKKELSQFFLDSTIDDLTIFKREYRHHGFYALMWFLLGAFVVFFINKKDTEQ